MKSFSKLPTLTLLSLVFVLLVYARQGLRTPVINVHKCPGTGWVASGNSFRNETRKSPGQPARTWVKEMYPYIWASEFLNGQTLVLSGQVQSNANEFSLNLLGGQPDITYGNTVVVFLLKFTFSTWGDNACIGDAYKNGKWLDSKPCDNMPLKRGSTFDLSIQALDDHIEVRCNNKRLINYQYRIPIDMVNYIRVSDDVDLSQAYIGGQKWDKTRTHRSEFPGDKLTIGYHMFLDAVPTGNFMLRFWDKKQNLLLQMKVDFETRVVSRTARINDKQYPTVTTGGFPFENDVQFELGFVNFPYGIKAYVDRNELFTFQHYTAHPEYAYERVTIHGRTLDIKQFTICEM